MTAIHLKSEVKIDFEQLLDGVTQLDTPALEHLLSQVSLVLARRKAPSLSRQESLLLQKINRSLPVTTQQRYDELRAKLHSETIAADEYQELLGLIDEVELADANRLQALIELAHLRNVSLAEVMDQLGIHPRHRSIVRRYIAVEEQQFIEIA
jgi:hypothetical protein